MAFGYVQFSSYDEALDILFNTIEKDGDVEVRRNAIKSVGSIFSRHKSMNGTFLRYII